MQKKKPSYRALRDKVRHLEALCLSLRMQSDFNKQGWLGETICRNKDIEDMNKLIEAYKHLKDELGRYKKMSLLGLFKADHFMACHKLKYSEIAKKHIAMVSYYYRRVEELGFDRSQCQNEASEIYAEINKQIGITKEQSQ